MRLQSRASGCLPSGKVHFHTFSCSTSGDPVCFNVFTSVFAFLRFPPALPVASLLPVQPLPSEPVTQHPAGQEVKGRREQ